MSLTPTLPSIFLPSSNNSNLGNAVKLPNKLCVRSSKAEGPLRRPSSPTIKEATPPMRPVRPSPPPSSDSSAPPPPPPPGPTIPSAKVGVKPSTSPSLTLEYQRQRAKELQDYFTQKKIEDQASRTKVFGFTPKNEISNGRWAMFGFAVGLLTEYATGSDFVDQMKILISNFGIADFE